MNTNYYFQLDEYMNNSPTNIELNWFELPPNLYTLLKESNKLITIRKLLQSYGKDKDLNKKINGLKLSIGGKVLKLEFPINLNQESYIKLYALMISEGSIRTEFSLNVPEKEFHDLFQENLKKLISKDIDIKKDFNNNFERSRAPAIIRYLIPIPNHLPKILFENKEFAREYLKIVFEAEGCPIFNLKRSKKYIKLSRNRDVSALFEKEIEHIPEEKRIFINKIKKQYPFPYKKLINRPDSLILGEHLLLKYWFDIDSSIKLENLRLNKLGNRKGKVSAKEVLYIYSGEDLEKFHKKVGFLSQNKKNICKEMLEKISSRKKQYFALTIMRRIQKNNIFSVKDFNSEMKKIGYTSPQKFVWDYWKNKKIIKRMGRAKYKILN